jgi:hypothetical protein
MTPVDKDLFDIIKDGQTDEPDNKRKGFVRKFAGRVRDMVELKNPLCGNILVYDIDNIIEIIDPKLRYEIDWFNKLKIATKRWCNDKIISNRVLGLKNDNEYDVRVFEKIVIEKFFMQLKGKPNYTAIIETDFKTMVEMDSAFIYQNHLRTIRRMEILQVTLFIAAWK